MTRRPVNCGPIILLGILVPSLAGGCGDGSGRQRVSGAVTFKGEPVDQGSIEFLPEAGGASHAGAVIDRGSYTIPAAKGLVPGTYAVKIYWPERKASPEDAPGPLGPVPRDRIPVKYNSKTTLTREVKKGVNAIDFHLD